MVTYGPWLNEWPDVLPDGSVWEWESDGWDGGPNPATFRAEEGVLYRVPDGTDWRADTEWGSRNFHHRDRIRRVYEPAVFPGEDELADARDNLCEVLGLSTSSGDDDVFAAAVARIRALEATMQLGAIQRAALERVDEMGAAQRGEET